MLAIFYFSFILFPEGVHFHFCEEHPGSISVSLEECAHSESAHHDLFFAHQKCEHSENACVPAEKTQISVTPVSGKTIYSKKMTCLYLAFLHPHEEDSYLVSIKADEGCASSPADSLSSVVLII